MQKERHEQTKRMEKSCVGILDLRPAYKQTKRLEKSCIGIFALRHALLNDPCACCLSSSNACFMSSSHAKNECFVEDLRKRVGGRPGYIYVSTYIHIYIYVRIWGLGFSGEVSQGYEVFLEARGLQFYADLCQKGPTFLDLHDLSVGPAYDSVVLGCC